MGDGPIVAVGPLPAPVAVRDVRWELAAELLRGSGIEIGALHLPMRVPDGVLVRYVDRMTVPELREHYPELAELDLARVDIVDDGELLSTVADESVDFIVANHFLEHCEDPIRTIGTHLGKLRPGGVLFYAVPDKRYTFDWQRPRTPLSHVVADHELGADRSRSEHYLEWVRLVDGSGADLADEQDVIAKAAELEASGYSIHFHVWEQADLLELMLHCHERFGSFEIEAVRIRSLENIVVLRKHGHLAAAALPAAPPAAPPAVPPDAQPATLEGSVASTQPDATAAAITPTAAPGTIPLSALRMRLDHGSAQAHWSVDLPDVPERALVQPAGCGVTYPLTLAGAVSLHARIRLVPHDWRDGTGSLRAWIATTQSDGSCHEQWSGRLRSAAEHGDPVGLELNCELPASTTALLLGINRPTPRDERAVGRAMWLQPRIIDPNAGPDPTPPHSTDTPRPAPPTATGTPLISVLTPVHDPPLAMLDEAIASVTSQTFPDWELCLVDDGSRNPEIIQALQRHAASDPRIHLHRHEQPGGISTATNTALKHASGDYIALLDHDDTLEPHALQLVADTLHHDPTLDMIYTDEDIVMNDRRIWAHLKPAWSPDVLRTNGYTCHLGVYRRSIVEAIGGFRSAFNGSQDVDMILRLSERTDRIAHIPEILYHWRAHASSTAGGDAKPYAYVAARQAIAGHLERSGVDGQVDYGPPGLYRVVHRVDDSLTVAVILAREDARGLSEAARSWLSQPHESWEVVLAAPPSALPACVAALEHAGVQSHRITTIPTDPALGTATALATAATAANTDHLLLMQSPVIGLTHDWLRRLLGYSNQPGIAAAGPIVLAPDGRITEAGIALPDGIPLPLLHGQATSMDELFGFGTSVHNVSALSGVLMTPRSTFEELHGLRPELGELALIDLCLRATDTGRRIVTVPDARVRTTAEQPTNNLPNLWQLRHSWLRRHTHDPYYSPHYRTDRGDFRLRASGHRT